MHIIQTEDTLFNLLVNSLSSGPTLQSSELVPQYLEAIKFEVWVYGHVNRMFDVRKVQSLMALSSICDGQKSHPVTYAAKRFVMLALAEMVRPDSETEISRASLVLLLLEALGETANVERTIQGSYTVLTTKPAWFDNSNFDVHVPLKTKGLTYGALNPDVLKGW